MEFNVLCIYANKYEECRSCSHSIPHKKHVEKIFNQDVCTKWGECSCGKKVRCVKTVKED